MLAVLESKACSFELCSVELLVTGDRLLDFEHGSLDRSARAAARASRSSSTAARTMALCSGRTPRARSRPAARRPATWPRRGLPEPARGEARPRTCTRLASVATGDFKAAVEQVPLSCLPAQAELVNQAPRILLFARRVLPRMLPSGEAKRRSQFNGAVRLRIGSHFQVLTDLCDESEMQMDRRRGEPASKETIDYRRVVDWFTFSEEEGGEESEDYGEEEGGA